jgi:heavy metal translocating P-type ATPase
LRVPLGRSTKIAAAAAALLVLGGSLRAAGQLRPELLPLSRWIWYGGLLLTGAPVVARTVREMTRGRFGGDVVASLSILGALLLGEPFAGLVIVLMQTGGETLEALAEGRASAAVRDLEAAAPRTAHRLRDGATEDVAVEQVSVGEILLVRPGELVPCDGVVLEGFSTLDTSRLTGEPLPRDARPGAEVASGSGNGPGSLRIRATARARDSQYARIVELVRSAQAEKAPIQRLADRYAVWFTPLTLLVCGATWWWSHDPLRVLAVLVVATPCPLILATPVAIIGGINRAARRQIVVRHGTALEQMGATGVLVLDKTGTLTLGRPEVRRIVPCPGWTEAEALRLAAALEHESGHLLARGVVTAAAARGLAGAALPAATDVVEAPGRGLTGRVAGQRVSVGSRRYLYDAEPDTRAAIGALADRFAAEPGVRAYVAVDGRAAGMIEYADRIREDAAAMLADLRGLGLERAILLSGDNPANVQAVGRALAIADARADLHPGEKLGIVRELVDAGHRVLFVGDGTNDAPAMAAATVGVALAAHGGGITAEAAGVVLLADDLGRIPEAVRISRKTMRVARQSLIVGLGLSGVAMGFAALGRITPVAGALLQELIDVAVILNALRTSR